MPSFLLGLGFIVIVSFVGFDLGERGR